MLLFVKKKKVLTFWIPQVCKCEWLWNVRLQLSVCLLRQVKCSRLALVSTDSWDTTHSAMSYDLGLLQSSGGQRSPRLHVDGTAPFIKHQFSSLTFSSCGSFSHAGIRVRKMLKQNPLSLSQLPSLLKLTVIITMTILEKAPDLHSHKTFHYDM